MMAYDMHSTRCTNHKQTPYPVFRLTKSSFGNAAMYMCIRKYVTGNGKPVLSRFRVRIRLGPRVKLTSLLATCSIPFSTIRCLYLIKHHA